MSAHMHRGMPEFAVLISTDSVAIDSRIVCSTYLLQRFRAVFAFVLTAVASNASTLVRSSDSSRVVPCVRLPHCIRLGPFSARARVWSPSQIRCVARLCSLCCSEIDDFICSGCINVSATGSLVTSNECDCSRVLCLSSTGCVMPNSGVDGPRVLLFCLRSCETLLRLDEC